MMRLLLLLTISLTVFAQPTAEIVKRFSSDMERPTDLAVLDDGRICVADGVNGRVMIFNADGSSNSLVFPEMKRPLGLAADHSGGLLITDTDQKAIFILDKYLNLKAHLPLGSEVDPTDVQPIGEALLWVVDNDGHQIIVMDRQGHIKEQIGRKGSTGPTFNYPSTISANSNSQVFVCDVLNGRIQLFDFEGVYRGQIADWGIMPGTLFRPKGVGAHPSGAFVVTDSFTGKIQHFTSQSSAGSVLPVQLKNPLGISWGKQGLLWVVESATGDVLGIQVN